jgi:4-hydroxy-3-methylbut-2-enyl diphosphate reductase
MERRHGETVAAERFRSFDTICSATQDRQDAVVRMLDDGVDVVVVIGGYNSSNTTHLAALCAERVPSYHVEDSDGVDPERGTIRYRPAGTYGEAEQADWLPPSPVTVGVTAGASTPNNKVGEVIARIFATRGIEVASALG